MIKKCLLFFLILALAVTTFSNPLNVNASSTKTVSDLWKDKDYEAAELIIKHLNTYTDANGKMLMKVVDNKDLDKGLAELNYSMTASELEGYIQNFNELIVKDGVLSDFTNQVSSDLEKITKNGSSEISVSSVITCSNVLGAIGLIHAGSYTAAALALGISGGLSASIPFIISTAYYLGSTLCK
ncbi:hypothetical protein P8884_15805 [Bacillus haynesii]|nr:hypothetical protein [Bacillus haynesii]